MSLFFPSNASRGLIFGASPSLEMTSWSDVDEKDVDYLTFITLFYIDAIFYAVWSNFLLESNWTVTYIDYVDH